MNIKCNICGGDVSLSADKTFATCEYCGSTITVPKISDEQRAAAFNRGNHFRRIGEFDKALASYERILREDDTDAEAHWCAALCRFGIDYVEDPATYEWLPTCHRASFDSFTEDVDFKAAMEHSDGLTRRLYQKEGAKIAEVQRGILATSQNEEPYDVFICYKETGEDGLRTKDSILAQDIYYQLTDQGHRVFFSRITLEDKAGSQYEPYIFAALNSAKVMVTVGTKPEHFSAVWVKNEWSRFLALMRKDRSRVLLPCYRDMDPYDLPEQLAVLQSYDMGKIGFIQDLIHGVDKVVKAGKAAPAAVVQQVQETVQTVGSNADALMERGFMALEDHEWQKADQFFEDALNQNAKLARAYLGKFLAEQKVMDLEVFILSYLHKTSNVKSVRKIGCDADKHSEDKAVEQFEVPGFLEEQDIRAAFAIERTYESISDARHQQYKNAKQFLDQDKNLMRVKKFGDNQLRKQVEDTCNSLLVQLNQQIIDAEQADQKSISDVRNAYARHIQNVLLQLEDKHEQALTAQMDYMFERAVKYMNNARTRFDYLNAKILFDQLGDYTGAASMSSACQEIIDRMQTQLWRDSLCCQHCGGKFKGVIVMKCADCGKPKDY